MPVLVLQDKDQARLFAEAVSRLFGWLYFLAWSASFWPQALLNHRRKSVSGVSLDYLALNALGFACYSIFNIAFYSSPLIRTQYRERNQGHDNAVRLNDLAFALHAFVLASWTLVQTFIYKREPGQKISRTNKAALAVMIVSIVAVGVTCAVTGGADGAKIEWIDFVLMLSYMKLYITFTKYMPQAKINYQRKSTEGFSIQNILLDFSGGILSLAQLVLDAALNNDWSAIKGDPAKFGLSLISMLFDTILMIQHYALYRGYSPSSSPEGRSGTHTHRRDAQATSAQDQEAQQADERTRLLQVPSERRR